MKKKVLIFLICISAADIYSQEYLTGELHGNYESGEYIVSGNVYVLPGKSLVFAPGTVLKFEPFTGIVVRGSLLCRGTSQERVLLTSVKKNMDEASGTSPAAFDWNGIKLEPDAKLLDFKYVKLEYSTFGIKIEGDSSAINIEKCLFRENGYAHLMKGEEYVNITPGKEIDYSLNYDKRKFDIDTKKQQKDKKSIQLSEGVDKKDGNGRWKTSVRIGSTVAAVGGLAAWIAGYSAWDHYNTEYSKAVLDEEREDFDKKRGTSKTASILGAVFCVLGTAGFSVTFFF